MEKINNLSLKKTIILYLSVSLLCSFFLSAFIVMIATKEQQEIWRKYIDVDEYARASEAAQADGRNYVVLIPRVSRSVMSETDWQISELCDFLETFAVLLISIAGSCVAVLLFYRNKLKIPIEELGKASELIAQDELDFSISYRNQDEMGKLCKEFEKMRIQLSQNNRTLWQMVEEEKALRAAIAHDIRLPLSVLKGYQEMLLEFIPDETFGQEKTIEFLQEGMKQIERMNRFIETMRNMAGFKDKEILCNEIILRDLGERIRREAEIISNPAGKVCAVKVPEPDLTIQADVEIILEVTENLLSNALGYARNNVEIFLSVEGEELIVTVSDDGKGFTENQDTVTKVFYHSNPQDNLEHSGMGMYISRIYCEKHGGRLLIGNQEHGGAIVKAFFKIRKK